jgi:hypothetical protein
MSDDQEISDLFNQLKQLHIQETILKQQIHRKVIESRLDIIQQENRKLRESDTNNYIPIDRFGKDIVVNKTAVLLTTGKSKVHKGKVVKVTNTRTTIVDKKGRLHWRAHNNIHIVD